MRWSTAALLVPALTGCSFIYNPNNLPNPPVEAGIDAPPLVEDANPTMLELLGVSPATIDEGEGDSGSAPALLVIHGHQLVNANLKVELAAPAGVTVHLDPVTDALASHDGDYLAFTVRAHVDKMLATDVLLDVTVTQDISAQYGGGMAQKTLAGKLTLRGLPELTSLTATLLPEYSMVELANVTFPAGANPVAIKAASSIKLGAVVADASGTKAGPGGYDAGANAGPGFGGPGGAATLLGVGGGGGGAGLAGAGAAGTTAAGTGGTAGRPTGEDQILSLTGNRASAGGQGGGGLSALGGTPGASGGGGGGMIVLTAGGDITTGTVSAIGAGGGKAGGGLASGGGGGGGAGGAVIVRSASGTVTMGTIRVPGGLGGTPGGGNGSVGRVRWDAPVDSVLSSPDRPAHRGPAFMAPTRVVTTAGQAFTLKGTPGDELDVRVTDQGNTPHAGEHASFNSVGIATITPTLYGGYNQLCVKLAGGAQNEAVANTCIDVAFLP
jgi:hypothetical protein